MREEKDKEYLAQIEYLSPRELPTIAEKYEKRKVVLLTCYGSNLAAEA